NITEKQVNYYTINIDTLVASMEENDLLFKENSAELFAENILEYETFDENCIKPEVFDKTSSSIPASSSINTNSSKSMVHPLKRRRTDPIWSVIDETEKYLNKKDWAIAMLFEPISQATCLLSIASYPTMGDLYTTFPVIIDCLENTFDNNDDDNIISSKKQIVQKMHTKLLNYWIKLRKQCYLSVILDPNLKLFSFAADDILMI
ncbi:4739_t:CDS:2, partial [Gigaspora margarita]